MTIPRIDWVGLTLSAGRYRVTSKLGEGGMGFVYKAWDRNIEADVVVKVPRGSMLEQPDFAARFAREIRSLVRLSHPQIVKVSDVGENEGLPFAVMQYLPGGDLDERRPIGPAGRPAPAPPGSLAGWLPGVASALDYIHREGYIHRDVKPANILFDGQGHPFLGDFGVAKVLGAVEASSGRGAGLTGAGMVLGTPEYMAPELVMGSKFDGRVDQYALAVTAYEMLCGRKPFEGEAATAILVRQANQEPPPPNELRGPGSDELKRLILRGLAKDPARRFDSCSDFAAAMVRVASSMASPEQKLVAEPPPGRIRCPACTKDFAIPSAVLAAPERARGRKTACPACKAPLRFANEGLGLRVDDEADRSAPGTVIAMGPATQKIESPRVARTVQVGTNLDSRPGRAAGTVKVSAIPGQGRVAGTVLVSSMEEDLAPMAATVKLESLLLSPATPRNSKSRLIPMIAGAIACIVVISAGYFAFVPNPERAVARLDPAKEPRPGRLDPATPPPKAIPSAVVDPEPSPAPVEVAPVLRVAEPPSIPAEPEPTAPESVATMPDQPIEEKPDQDAEVGNVIESGPPPEPEDHSLITNLTLDDVAREPEKHLGRLVFPTELLWIGNRIEGRSGPYLTLSVLRTLMFSKKARPSDSPLPIVATEEVASNLRSAMRRLDPSAKFHAAIADLRIVRDSSRPSLYIAVAEHIELYSRLSPKAVSDRHWNKAFEVELVTPTEAKPTFGRGEEWRKRLDASYLASVRLDFKRAIAQNQDAVINLGMQAVARQAAEINKYQTQQQEQMRRRSFGVDNFPR
ncbi:protein kinase domain-containing protein [Tundrisphaera lichenicola]|uniref:protein kinase domain-containing protein n=1 Tax=Tundrisphaera lichenicola TaxID=2029860 RepID=UPI003EBAD2B5